MATKTTFLSRFCARYHFAPSEFEGELFWHCLPPHGRAVVLSIWLCPRGLFEEDYRLIEAVKEATSFAEINQAIIRHHRSLRPREFLRDVCRIRLSSNRLNEVAQELFLPRPVPSLSQEAHLPWNAGRAVQPGRPNFNEVGITGNGAISDPLESSAGLAMRNRI
jgi:hypothetical protein